MRSLRQMLHTHDTEWGCERTDSISCCYRLLCLYTILSTLFNARISVLKSQTLHSNRYYIIRKLMSPCDQGGSNYLACDYHHYFL